MIKYHGFRGLFFLSAFLEGVALPMWVGGIFHVFYFYLTTFDAFDPRLDIAFSCVYGAVLIWLLVRGIRYIFHHRNLFVELENRWPFNFELINLAEEFRDSKRGPFVHRFFALLGRRGKFLGLLRWKGLIPVFCLFFFMVLQPQAHLSFYRYLTAPWGLGNLPEVTFSAPDRVIEGEAAHFHYEGPYASGIFYWEMGNRKGETYLTNGQQAEIAKAVDDIHWTVAFRPHRRAPVILRGEVRVSWKPRLISLAVDRRDPIRGHVDRIEGSTRIMTLPNSQVTLFMAAQEDQHLHSIIWEKTDGVPRRAIRKIESPSSNEIAVRFIVRRPVILEFRLENRLGLISEKAVGIEFTSMENAPPSVEVLSPKSELTVSQKADQKANVIFSDDIALKSFELFLSKTADFSTKEATTIHKHWAIERNPKQLKRDVSLPVDSIEFSPGETLYYCFVVSDFYGLKGYSKTNKIRYLDIDELQENIETKIANFHRQSQQDRESLTGIKKDLERMKILSERGELESEDIQLFQEQMKETREKIADKKEQLNRMIDDVSESKEAFPPSVLEKLKQIDENIKKLDEKIAQRLSHNIENLMNQVGLSKKEIAEQMQNISLEKLEETMDEVLRQLRHLNSLGEIEKLATLADRLLKRHEEERARSLSREDAAVYNESKPEIEKLYETLAEQYREIASNLAAGAPPSPAQEKLDRLLSENEVSAYQKKSLGKEDFPTLESLSEHFSEISRLTREMKDDYLNSDIEAIYQEIDRQVAGYLSQADWLDDLLQDRVLDLEKTSPDFLRQKLGRFLSEMESITRRSKMILHSLTAGRIPGILEFLEEYDYLISTQSSFKKRLNPSISPGTSWKAQMPTEFEKQRIYYMDLTTKLIALKQYIRNQTRQSRAQDSLSRASRYQRNRNARLEEMLKGKLSSAQMKYLRNSLAGQAMIRSLLEEMRDTMAKQGKDGQARGRKDEQGNPSETDSPGLARLQEIIRQMKELEDSLKLAGAEDGERIRRSQDQILENLLQFEQGIKGKSSPKDDETNRQAETGEKVYAGFKGKLPAFKKTLEEHDRLIRGKSYPREYAERIQKYLESLRNKLGRGE